MRASSRYGVAGETGIPPPRIPAAIRSPSPNSSRAALTGCDPGNNEVTESVTGRRYWAASLDRVTGGLWHRVQIGLVSFRARGRRELAPLALRVKPLRH